MNTLSSDENEISKDSLRRPRSRKAKAKRRIKEPKHPKRPRRPVVEDSYLPGIGTMARTRRLILAALRVWELRRGIREY